LQISVVFPRDTGRYQDADFRQLVERTVQEEAPAHLIAYILWKNDADMEAFASAYAAWLREWRSHGMAAFGM
jgi:hypothetical protein